MKKASVWGTYGGLGPDLDKEAVIVKKAMLSKVEDFSTQLREINKAQILQNMKDGFLHEPKPKQQTSREKALNFARSISKPPNRTRIPPITPKSPLSPRQTQLETLHTLLKRHEEMDRQVNRIKLRYLT